MSLEERLEKIRSPKLQNQQQRAIVLSAVEDTLRDQHTPFTPAAYFAALLALLTQAISPNAANVKSDVATAVVGLLDIIVEYTPAPLLRSKFAHIFTHLAPALAQADADAPLLRPCIGCLESLLIAQDTAAWSLPAAQISPRRGIAALLILGSDHRPKVRKRAQEALAKVLKAPPPSPSLDHPAADMCAETAMRQLAELVTQANSKQRRRHPDSPHDPKLIHALQLVKTIATASGGWPSRKIEQLCDLLLNITKSSHEYLTMAAFDVFEVMFASMNDEVSSAKLPRLIEAVSQLRPARTDSQLLPPWIAVMSRAYEVSAVVSPEDTFQQLPELFESVSSYLDSPSHNIRISASECLISFLASCIPDQVLLEPSIYDEKVFEKLARTATELLSVKYQAAWKESFNVLSAMFEAFAWRANPLMRDIVTAIGDLRGNDAFADKQAADGVLGKALQAMGPRNVLDILPLNLVRPQAGQPGRAWLLPILRDHIINTELAHFREVMVPVSEVMFQRVLDHGKQQTMETKIFETVVQQIWATLPGYCTIPVDVTAAFDQSFAELLTNVIYQHVSLRVDVCKALQSLIESNKEIIELEDENPIQQRRMSKAQAQQNLEHIAKYAGSWLSVLFNVYSETLPQSRGYILNCINAFLSITNPQELAETFTKVTTMLQTALQDQKPQTQAEKQKKQQNALPPTSHTLMDLVITMSIYLPRESFSVLFNIAAAILAKADDAQLQKKAYKLIPRLASSEIGAAALRERNPELQTLLLQTAESATAPARRDRLEAISQVVANLPSEDLHFVPAILSEVVISTKEANEKARTAAFDLLVVMGEQMKAGGTVHNAKVAHMPDDAASVPATLDEFFSMVSAGLAGSTPHMISASITAITRILFEFREELREELLTELVSTMDLFLTSTNREIVRSVLGFVKVAVISLPASLMEPRLPSLITNLMVWSHEHKAHFRAKVKHILERIIRRFGIEIVEKNVPEEDKKLIVNIRKTRERKKRRKEAADAEGEDDEAETGKQPAGRFASAFDEALHDSSDDDAESDQDSDAELTGRGSRNGQRGGNSRVQRKGESFIVEDPDEPLDLLDRRSLAHISSARPTSLSRKKGLSQSSTRRNGKLVISEEGGVRNAEEDDGDQSAMDVDGSANANGNGINAYIDAVAGKDTYTRQRGGRIKFSNRRSKDAAGDNEEDGMEIDGQSAPSTSSASRGSSNFRGRGSDRGRGFGRGRGGNGGGRGGVHPARRGLGIEKRRNPSEDFGRNGSGNGGYASRGSRNDRGGSSGGGRGRGRVVGRGRVGKVFRGRGARR